ncbi:MAG: HDOD domain-containing protein [Desulfobacterales bacterium]|jgi:HD-like signal output (HDOD) protein|nr:HDOD domain-containing protein [Desulfobacterales bacterium]
MNETTSFKDIIDAHLTSNQVELPVFDKTALKIQQETAKPEPDIAEIESLIITDQALTGQVIKMANTAFFRGLTKVATVRDAIVRLGTDQVCAIVILVTQKANFKSKDKLIQTYMTRLWRHSVGTAIGAGWLSVRCGYPRLKDQAFVAGLLHDVGKLFLLTVIEFIRRDPKLNFNPSDTFMNEIMDSLHTEHGFMLMTQWNLPEAYCDVAKEHHKDPSDNSPMILLLVQMADITCNKMGIGLHDPSELILAATPVAQLLGLSELDIAELEIALEDSSILAL